MTNKPKSVGDKVVRFESDGERMTRAKLARLPEAILGVKDLAMQSLHTRLRQYFERADDSLFDLADKASSNEEQNLFFDSMREIRVRRHGIETNFTEALNQAFAALAVAGATSGEEDLYDTLKADALSLVADDDLEALVAVDSSVARANADFGEAIQFISLRLDSLVPVKVYQKNNPVGPDVVCAAFMAEIKKLDVSTKAKLLLFRLFDNVVIAGLGDIYEKINGFLIENNVMPSLPGRHAQRAKPQRRSTDGAHQTGAGAVQGDEIVTSGGNISREVATALTNLFGSQILTEGAVTVSQEQLAANQLVQLLNAAQHMPVQDGNIVKAGDIRGMLGTAVGQAQLSQVRIGRVEDQVMNLVNMLFDFILEDRNVPDAMKALISRMQIPVIKVALADKTFFTKKGNVARKLLNEMATAAIGWQCDPENMDRDPLYRKVDSIVRKLLSDFSTDTSIFNDLLADFTAFLEKESKRVAVLERRTVDAEDGKAKAEIARARVAEELNKRCEPLELPPAIATLLYDAWSNALFVCALKHGYESPIWTDMLATADELLWSVQAPTSQEERRKLIKAVPGLLKKLRTGLETISYNPFEMSKLFKALEAVHLACIRGSSAVVKKVQASTGQDKLLGAKPSENAEDSSLIIRAPDAKATQSTDTEQDDKQRQIEEITLSGISTFGMSTSTPRPEATKALAPDEPEGIYYQQVENFVRGAWFEMDVERGETVRCRYAAYIKPTGKYIFVNRNGMKVAEKSKRELAVLLKQSRLKALDNSMLFDRALETIVAGMRRPEK